MFLHRRAELSKLRGHSGDAVRLLHPPVGDAANARRALGEEGHHPEGHGRIGDGVKVYVYSPQRAPFRFEPVRSATGDGPGLGEDIKEGYISLHAVPAHAGHAYGPPGEGAQGKKVGGGGRIPFHGQVPRSHQGRRWDGELSGIGPGTVYPKMSQAAAGDLQVGVRNQFAFPMDSEAPG